MTKNYIRAGLVALMTLTLTNCSNDKEDPKKNDPNSPNSPSADVTTIRVSAIPDSDTTDQKVKYQVLVDYLTEALGDKVKVEFVPAADYASSVEKFTNGDIQLAWFGGVTGVQARQRVDGAIAIAAGKEDMEYKSYFIANASTGLTKSDDFPAAIADLKFTFGSRSSTSGHIMPVHFITENTGKARDDFFSQPVGFSNAHDLTAKQVEAGDYQAGALSYGTYDKMVAEGNLDASKAMIIWETPPYPDYNFTAHPDLGEDLINKIQEALLAIDGDTDQEKQILGVLNRSALVSVTNEDFDPIAEVMKAVKLESE